MRHVGDALAARFERVLGLELGLQWLSEGGRVVGACAER